MKSLIVHLQVPVYEWHKLLRPFCQAFLARFGLFVHAINPYDKFAPQQELQDISHLSVHITTWKEAKLHC